jgi:hypothetical protein
MACDFKHFKFYILYTQLLFLRAGEQSRVGRKLDDHSTLQETRTKFYILRGNSLQGVAR